MNVNYNYNYIIRDNYNYNYNNAHIGAFPACCKALADNAWGLPRWLAT